jgi:alpha-1,6-mannosyltransferase
VRTPARLTGTWGWAGLGLLGSALAAFTGSRLLGSDGVRWWYTASFPSGHTANKILFWLGIAALCAAWLGLGRATERTTPAELWTIGALWCLPLLLGPPLFSRDVYSYLAQGTLIHLGHSPYHEAPIALARLHHQHVLSGVDPFWRNTKAPYGPLFLGVISLMVGMTGSHLVAGAIAIRAFDFVGILLLAVFVPRLARAAGTDPRRALWLALLSPLVLLQLVSPAHNDALMVGLMVAGVALALERRPLLGIALCAVAATVKVPAAAAIIFILVAWARTLPERRDQLRAVAKSVAVTVAIAAAVTLVTGLGLAWISTGLFNTPGRVRLSITPATALGYTIAHALHHVSVPLNGKQFEATVSHVTFAIAAVYGLALLYRTRFENLVRQLGLLLVAVAIGGPAAWPWYFTWGLAVLACRPPIQRSVWLPVAIIVPAFIIAPNGRLVLTLSLSPYMLLLYLALVAIACRHWWARRRRAPRSHSGAASVLAHR